MGNSTGHASLANALGEALLKQGWMLATAESCTGGAIAAAITDIAGSSQWFERGFVTYSNAAKHEQLGVPAYLIERHGAVSREVAEAMAEGALERSKAVLAVAVTGIAGPDGGSDEKPVGTVWFGWAERKGDSIVTQATCRHFSGDRAAVRSSTVRHALEELARMAR
ncbi:MAG: CinA family protein [Gammaproteobacteria bacterium]|nr:CinA family protein [Gammaproteobacteria bacterium]